MVTLVRGDDGRTKITLLARYRDRFRRADDGSWRLRSRTGVSIGIPGEIGTDAEWARASSACPKSCARSSDSTADQPPNCAASAAPHASNVGGSGPMGAVGMTSITEYWCPRWQGDRGDDRVGDLLGMHEAGVAEEVHPEPALVRVHRATALQLPGREVGAHRLAAAQVEHPDAGALELVAQGAHGVLHSRARCRVRAGGAATAWPWRAT